MDRRNFIKVSAITGAATALESCSHPEHQLIRFIPEEDLVPGIAAWKPSVCTLCPAGCGLQVRVMEGDAEVIRNGQLGLMKMGLAKKLEGNPNHPVNHGKLCARGQAGLQVTYHPDRIRHPLKLTGPRGSGQYREASWEEALHDVQAQLESLRAANDAASLAFLSKPLRGQHRMLVEQFLSSFGAPPPVYFSLFDRAVERWANLYSFGRPQTSTLDLARANYAISFGADFLGTWNSPLAQSAGYGIMRQGRPGQRAKLVQVEPRLSQTGANADEWIAGRPGTEAWLALGIAHVILNEKLLEPPKGSAATTLIASWNEGLPQFTPQAVEAKTGVAAETVQRLAREISAHLPAVAFAGDAALAHTNGAFTALAVNALNALLGSVENAGGIFFTPPVPGPARPATTPALTPQGGYNQLADLVQQIIIGNRAPKALFLYGANPAYAAPGGAKLRSVVGQIPFIVSFGSFIDETSSLADLILPDHSPLESWLDDKPESGTTQATLTLAPPAVMPLHSTRAMADVLLDLAAQLGGDVAKALPYKSYDEILKSAYADLQKERGSISGAENADDFWSKLQEQGGWWSSEVKQLPPERPAARPAPVSPAEPEFAGSESEYPYHFLPFPSPMFYDGSLAHLPWMQETPDALTTAMWSSWVEINPQTAAKLNIKQADLVEVASEHGTLRAPAVLTPGIAPDVIAMPAGQGHENFTRYASGRGANPVSILAPKIVAETGSLAWAATRVKISRVGEGKLTLFSGGLSTFPHPQR